MIKLKFSELININVLKTMTENLYRCSGIPVGIFDTDGNAHVTTGWQEICTKYHRANPISCERCINSDNYIKQNINDNTYIEYKCENNLWDISMPIIISGEHVASVIIGQFFYENEIIDENFFRRQARELGFDEGGYIEALRKVPIFSKEKVNYMLMYYSGLITTLADSGYRLLEYERCQERLKKSQQYFKTILDTVSDSIFISDINGQIIDVNKTAIQMYGYTKEELINMDIQELFINDFQCFKSSVKELIKDSSPLVFMNISKNKQNKEICTEINLNLTTIDGEERIVTAVRDISERKQAELALISENLELEKLRTEFFANISHELRTPLNIILSSNQVMKKYLQDETMIIDRKKLISNINMGRQNCFRLLRLINNLIDVTKMDSGLFELNLVNCDIVNVVEEIVLSTADYMLVNGLTLIFDTDVEEKIIACDPDKIERIILNLLSNSIKFTDRGGTILVNIFDGEDYITISVEDNGIGIPGEKLNFIFQRFRQVDKSFTRNHEGSGIGLSLVKSLVEMHKGDIFVESLCGKGTKFIIKLPIKTLDSYNTEQFTEFNNSSLNNFVERINIEFSDIYKLIP